MKVLVVAAHPDDELLGCGGTVTKLAREGHEVRNLILGNGRETALDNEFDKKPLLYWVKIIELKIAGNGPDVIFTHCGQDLNIDHKITYNAVITAARPMPNCPVKEIYSFEIPSSTEWNSPACFAPDTFYKLNEDDIERKWAKLINTYPKEMRDWPHPRSREGIFTLAKYRGMQSGFEYAEAFKMVRRIV